MDLAEQQKNDKMNEEIDENLRIVTAKMGKRITELMEGMAQKNEEIIGLKVQNKKLIKENRAVKRKMTRTESYIPEAKKLLISHALPAELLNEIFALLPLKNAFDILTKMPNGFLARNVRRILNSINMEMKANKWNELDCGPKLAISDDGLKVMHIDGLYENNYVRAQLPTPFPILNSQQNLNPFYFEVHILKLGPAWGGIEIGFCPAHFPINIYKLGSCLSIGISDKDGMLIDGFWKQINQVNHYFLEGDVVGIGLVYSNKNSSAKCFATCNGELLGPQIELPKKFIGIPLFPATSLYHAGNAIRANFGNKEWLFNPKQLIQ